MHPAGIPSERLQEALIDFYILSRGVPPQFDVRTFQPIRMGVINAWKRTLIRDIEFCMACEARHMRDHVAAPKGANGWPAWFKLHFGEVGEAWYSRWCTLAASGKPKASDVPAHWADDVLADVAYVTAMNAGNMAERLRSYIAAKHAEEDLGLSLIEVCTRLFDPTHVAWRGAYGGKAWMRIAQTLFSLWLATDATEIVHLIDTAFALHHNTNVVFNKNSVWACGGQGHVWIQRWLDYKWAANSPVSLLGLASDALQATVAHTGFHLRNALSPEDLAKPTNFPPGQCITILDGAESCDANVVLVAGDYFRSVVLASDHYQVEKTFGKTTKTLHNRVYLLEELLPILFCVKIGSYAVGVDMAKQTPQVLDPPHYAEFLAFKPQLAALYDFAEAAAIGLGGEIGTYLEDGTTVRFRVKGLAKPLRFYFMMVDAGLRMSVGHTVEADLADSTPVLVAKSPTDDQLQEAVTAAFADLGGAA